MINLAVPLPSLKKTRKIIANHTHLTLPNQDGGEGPNLCDPPKKGGQDPKDQKGYVYNLITILGPSQSCEQSF
jgi:hypothetical protein